MEAHLLIQPPKINIGYLNDCSAPPVIQRRFVRPGDRVLGIETSIDLLDFVKPIKVPADLPTPEGMPRGRISPIDYFASSGDALKKCAMYRHDLMVFRDVVMMTFSNDELSDVVEETLNGAERLALYLVDLRQDFVHLECVYEDGLLIVCPKDPRAKPAAHSTAKLLGE